MSGGEAHFIHRLYTEGNAGVVRLYPNNSVRLGYAHSLRRKGHIVLLNGAFTLTALGVRCAEEIISTHTPDQERGGTIR